MTAGQVKSFQLTQDILYGKSNIEEMGSWYKSEWTVSSILQGLVTVASVGGMSLIGKFEGTLTDEIGLEATGTVSARNFTKNVMPAEELPVATQTVKTKAADMLNSYPVSDVPRPDLIEGNGLLDLTPKNMSPIAENKMTFFGEQSATKEGSIPIKMHGSGPASGVLGIYSDIESAKALLNYFPKDPIEYVYDSEKMFL